MLKATYKNDKLTGGYTIYNADGGFYTTGQYSAGDRAGKWTVFNEKGKPWIESQYKNGFEVKTDTLQ